MSEVGFAISESDGLKRVVVYRETIGQLKHRKELANTSEPVILKSSMRIQRVIRKLPYFFQKYGH